MALDEHSPLDLLDELKTDSIKLIQPTLDLAAKHAVAANIRDRIDTVREPELSKFLPLLVPNILESIERGQPAFRKDSQEFSFRRILLDTLIRLPFVPEVAKTCAARIFTNMLKILRNDNEENGGLACKLIIEYVKIARPPEFLAGLLEVFRDMVANMESVVHEHFSENSVLIDPNISLPSMRSLKAIQELGSSLLFVLRGPELTAAVSIIPQVLDFIDVQSPIQKKAREDFEAMGGIWNGMSEAIKNEAMYSDYILAEVKALSFVLFLSRQAPTPLDPHAARIMPAVIRILQDCPTHATAIRRDFAPVLRAFVALPSCRSLLVPSIEKLLEERVMFGVGVTGKEQRAQLTAALIDLIHHCKAEMSPVQLNRAFDVLSDSLLDSAITPMHVLLCRGLINMMDVLHTKDTAQSAIRTIHGVLETFLQRLEGLILAYTDSEGRTADSIDCTFIEKASPTGNASFVPAGGPRDMSLTEIRGLYRLLLHGIRQGTNVLTKLDAPMADGAYVFRMFDACIQAINLFDIQDPLLPRPAFETFEPVDYFGSCLLELNPHVFQEVWTRKIDSFFEIATKKLILGNLCQNLFLKESASPTLLAIMLKFLVAKLPELGEYDGHRTAATIRLFKYAFSAIANFPSPNEEILASFLPKIIMECFPLATKATSSSHYFLLLRALFRSIGGGGGKFERLYAGVLPLLPEMLACLNRQLLTSDRETRDIIVELCLTVPLRLTHLLPHLTYLMQPLALALRGGPELVSQGLRTLELCIDNLTPDFLDPTLNTVLRELTEALHSHLKPLPANPVVSHATIRILGKLGGRNRRLLAKDPVLDYKHQSEPFHIPMSLGGRTEKLVIPSFLQLARKTLLRGSETDVQLAYSYLENSLVSYVHEDIKGYSAEETFIQTMEGLFDAMYIPTLHGAATLIKDVTRHVLNLEVSKMRELDVLRAKEVEAAKMRKREVNVAAIFRPIPSSLFLAVLETWPHALIRRPLESSQLSTELVAEMIADLVGKKNPLALTPPELMLILHHIAGKFTSLCFEDPWSKKVAGWTGIRLMAETPDVGAQWVSLRQIDIVRALLHVLKDVTPDLSRDVTEVLQVLSTVLRLSNTSIDLTAPNNLHQVLALTSFLVPELCHANPIVRTAVQDCIQQLVDLTHLSVFDLFNTHRERLVLMLFTKPLRALSLSHQIGKIEAARYCISLSPPLIDGGEELLRLLHEVLAFADAEDQAIMGTNPRRYTALEIIKLRVSCIKLLTASMPLTDFFIRQHQTRQRVTAIYFKSLYSSSPEMKEVAHEGLRMVLLHQSSKLPKELLQTGLRPVLTNLADPKRLSIPGLDGLARLLELLSHYFKVEIGHKLLDHFSIVADSQMLLATARGPLADHEDIIKLVSLANIFHLLPATAHIFLDSLVNAIVQTEAQIHSTGPSPLSEPLAKYLNRYYMEGIEFFSRHLVFPRHLQTLRSVLQTRLAPNIERELAARTPSIVRHALQSNDSNMVLPALQLFNDMAALFPGWTIEQDSLPSAALNVWYRNAESLRKEGIAKSEIIQRYSLTWSILKQYLNASPRIDLLFDVVFIYVHNTGMSLQSITHFLYNHVALNDDLIFRRNVLLRFLTWFADPTHTWHQKAYALRHLINPILLVHASRTPHLQLVDRSYAMSLHHLTWRQHVTLEAETDDLFKHELLHLTLLVVQHYHHVFGDNEIRKEILKMSTSFMNNPDSVLKQTACLLNVRFFEVWEVPSKFISKTWTVILRLPFHDGRLALRQEIMSRLLRHLPTTDNSKQGDHSWPTLSRRSIIEDNLSQSVMIYHLITKEVDFYYPVRELFVPHMCSVLTKLGLANGAAETRMLSVDLIQTIADWDTQAKKEMGADSAMNGTISKVYTTPLHVRETIIGYLIRLLVMSDPEKNPLVPRGSALLRSLVGPNGWPEVTIGIRFFLKHIEQWDTNTKTLALSAIGSARVISLIAKEQNDAWYMTHFQTLYQMVRKGIHLDEPTIQDSLQQIFARLIAVYPLPKEEDEQQGEVGEFHRFVHSVIGDFTRNQTPLTGPLHMLKSVVDVTPERIEPYSANYAKLLGKVTRDNLTGITTQLDRPAVLAMDRPVILMMDTFHSALPYLGEHRRWFLNSLVHLVEKSISSNMHQYILTLARNWVLKKQDSYPTMKEKAALLIKMATIFGSKAFISKGIDPNGDTLLQPYLELIYEIYTEPSLRRSELTSRLEQPFLMGCRARDPKLRAQFMDLLDSSVPRSLFGRIVYICGVQSWEAVSDSNWIFIAAYLLLGALDPDSVGHDRRAPAVSTTTTLIPRGRSQAVIGPIQRLLFLDAQAAHETWVSLFPAVWATLSRREQTDVTQHMVNLLSKEYHTRQAAMRPNVIQTLLEGIVRCTPSMILPPHLVKYLAKNFGAWHVSVDILSSSLDQARDDDTVREYVFDSLADVYAELGEDDLFYGVWRRRCLHDDTNIAIAFEQTGMWEQASTAYESAQAKARTGVIPFTEAEYCLWEDHWVLSAEKLQQWEVLHELARGDSNQELMLETAWRIKDWNEQRDSLEEQIHQLPEAPTPRRRVFEAFISLLKQPPLPQEKMTATELTRIVDDAMQLSLRKWVALPSYLSAAHVPLLQHFQQFVELLEAQQIFASLNHTTAATLEKRSGELKVILQAWRERLPNIHDDISIWSDLVAWRQNVFQAINKVYVPLSGGSATTNANNASTFGYRGYHETAWIINRFAHVARKHDLLDACFTSLAKIYALPNIEISEAFLKLREQARCHYQKPNDLQAGLEVINNTNLVYFSISQKAEFYTLKGMFYSRFGRSDDANVAFGQAIQMDLSQSKAWAEWGRYNDRLFRANHSDHALAANAVSCYMQAAGQYKNAKTRPLLARVLWLLGLDDGTTFTIARAFDTYKGDGTFWYWVTLIPQLLTSIHHREAKQARYILNSLARIYPQALFFPVRLANEEALLYRRGRAQAAQAAAAAKMDPSRPINGNGMADATVPGSSHDPAAGTVPPPSPHSAVENTPIQQKTGWDIIEELVQCVKTAFPLLILSLETMTDQFHTRFKNSAEEDGYRMSGILITDMAQSYAMRATLDDGDLLTEQQQKNHLKMAQAISGHVHSNFEDEILHSGATTASDLIQRLQRFRDKYERYLNLKPHFQPLENMSHNLVEFQYMKSDEIEVFGQYTEDKDSNSNFVKIQRFNPKFETYNTNGIYLKRIKIHGTDGSDVSFVMQYPCHRYARREEKVVQAIRTFNGVLARKKESRKRNLTFHLPVTIMCSNNIRLMQLDSSYISLGDIYDLHCKESGIAREDPLIYFADKMKTVWRAYKEAGTTKQTDFHTLKHSLLQEVTAKMVPEDVLTKFMIRTMAGPSELWRMRKQFTLQVASNSFITFVFCIASRHPARFQLSRSSGLMTMWDIIPNISSTTPILGTTDFVPFRLTANMQHFITPIFTEGLLAPAIMTIGRCLTNPEYDLEQSLSLFARDDMIWWYSQRKQSWTTEAFIRQCNAFLEALVARAEAMSCKVEREQAMQGTGTRPVMQTVINMISTATNPTTLMKMGEVYHPWF